MDDAISIYVVNEFSETEHVMQVMESVQSSEDLKKIPFDRAVQLAELAGLDGKLAGVDTSRVKTCYYRKPYNGPDELVVVLR